MSDIQQSIAVIGGTGGLGSALAYRWGKANHEIFVGSRSAEKAELAAAELNERLGTQTVRGMANREAAAAGNAASGSQTDRATTCC